MEPSCFVCTHPDFVEKRVEWGCDAPLAQAWAHIDCWRCRDEKPAHRAYCQTCNGTERIPLYRCPGHYVGAWEAWVVRVATLVDKGINPFSDPPEAWPNLVADAIVLVLAEKALIDRRAIEQARKGG